VVFNGLNIKGIYSREKYETWYKMTAMLQSGLDIAPVIMHRFRYPLIEEGFNIMRNGQSGKVIFRIGRNRRTFGSAGKRRDCLGND
jgi:threonine 3-dehydrogenase